MPVQIMNKFGKVVRTAESWRRMRAATTARAAEETLRKLDQDLKEELEKELRLDARTANSLMSGGSLTPLYRPAEDKDRARQPEKSWKQYPRRSGRTTRQWRVV